MKNITALAGRWYVQLAILLITFVLYLLTGNAFFGLLVAFEILAMVFLEVKQGAVQHGWKHEVQDTALALLVALGIWYGLSFILNTSSPVSAVASCSMLPNLQRGDFVVVQGAGINAYDVYMKESDIALLKSGSIVKYGNNTRGFDGSFYSYCIFSRQDPLCTQFSEHPEAFIEQKGPLIFHYSICAIDINSVSYSAPCVTDVDYAGKNYPENRSNDIIVYTPSKNEVYSLSGDIVHRAYFRITTDTGNIYYLTKGDNNPVLDIQVYDYVRAMGNEPIPEAKLKGKVLFRVPYLGYFKLLITPAVDRNNGLTSLGVMDMEQCRTQLKY